MSEPYETGLLPRSFFKAPRVPFDFRALSLGILGYLVYWAGGLLLSLILKGDADALDVNGSFLIWFAGFFQGVPYIGGQVANSLQSVFQIEPAGVSEGFWNIALGGLWFFAVWSLFGQAIQRITSLRVARDESLSIGEALKFGLKNIRVMLEAPLIILGAMGFFVLCNSVAGLITSMPIAGGLLGIVFYPLAVISTLLILLIGLGGVFGLPLISAAASWEVNGSLDAISRAFSYVFARPLQYFWKFFLIFLFTGVILLVGSWFNYTLLKSIDLWGAGEVQSILVNAPASEDDRKELSEDGQKLLAELQESTKTTGVLNKPTGRVTRDGAFVMSFDAVSAAPGTHKIKAFLLWALTNLIWLGVFGYAVFWIHGAATSIYADLREDVDGTEETEIWIEGEDDLAFETLAESGPTSEAGTEAPSTPEEPAAAESTEAAAPESPSAEAPKPDAGASGDVPAGEGGDGN